jgi:hypothetical protein
MSATKKRFLEWEKCDGKAKCTEPKDQIAKYIIERLGCRLEQFFRRSRKRRTTHIKVALAKLGDEALDDNKRHYKVYTNRLPLSCRRSDGGQFKSREFLYDLHWYEEVEDADYLPKRFNLVVECEWAKDRPAEIKKEKEEKGYTRVPYSAVKYDFQKLLVANAELRLMIFCIGKRRNDDEVDNLAAYFFDAIEKYEQLPRDSKFLIIGFDEALRGFRYIEIRKRNKSDC